MALRVHGNSKTRHGIHFMVELFFQQKRKYSERVERNQRITFDPLRVLTFLLNKSSIIKWMPRRVLEFPWISKVPSNPQLSLTQSD